MRHSESGLDDSKVMSMSFWLQGLHRAARPPTEASLSKVTGLYPAPPPVKRSRIRCSRAFQIPRTGREGLPLQGAQAGGGPEHPPVLLALRTFADGTLTSAWRSPKGVGVSIEVLP